MYREQGLGSNDFCKCRNSYVSAGDGYFEDMILTLYRNVLTELRLLFHKL